MFTKEELSKLAGKSIVFEGGDGSGKGTVIEALRSILDEVGADSVFLREPGGTAISEQIRSIIVDKENDDLTAKTEALLFAASRAQIYEEKIKPALEQNKILVLDRYVYSSYAYQGFARGLGIEDVKCINDFATEWSPDLVIYLDIDPDVAQERIVSNNRETNRLDLESIEFHKKVRWGYWKVPEYLDENTSFRILDASKDKQVVLENVINIIKETLC